MIIETNYAPYPCVVCGKKTKNRTEHEINIPGSPMCSEACFSRSLFATDNPLVSALPGIMAELAE